MSEVPHVERYTLTDLKALTAEADEYLNASKNHRTQKRRAKEVIEKLNIAIIGEYLHQPVRVYGIHKKIGRDKAGNLHVYLKDGEMVGLSEGFIVTDFETDFEDVVGDGSRKQADLLANLKEFSAGRYAVSHLVMLTTMVATTNDFLLQQSTITRGLSPASASEIFPELLPEITDDSKHLESERIAALSINDATIGLRPAEELVSEPEDQT